jgi:hypothetical protein
MQRYFLSVTVVLFLLALPVPSMASGEDDMEARLQELIAEVEDLGYVVVFSDVDYLKNNSEEREFFYPAELEPGDYVILAECEDNIHGLGLGVWSLDAFTNGGDPYLEVNNEENQPFLSLSASGDGTCVIGVWGNSFRRRRHESFYCILWAIEPDEDGEGDE